MMTRVKHTYWNDDNTWIGYLEEFPDYHTQGETEDDLKAHLIDLYKDLTSGSIPNVRNTADLSVV